MALSREDSAFFLVVRGSWRPHGRTVGAVLLRRPVWMIFLAN